MPALQLDMLGGPAVPENRTPIYRPAGGDSASRPANVTNPDAPAAPPASVSVTRPIGDLAPGATFSGTGA